ncbi:MAG TPA: hypothetical protein VMC10_26095 [Stellaceae bacterium]|nr:hypothetical protein [Stellaceae bacterium]
MRPLLLLASLLAVLLVQGCDTTESVRGSASDHGGRGRISVGLPF